MLLLEVARSEGKASAESVMPVFPIVDAVADAQFTGDELTAHFFVEVEALREQEIVVAYVEEPTYGAQRVLHVVGGIL